MNQITILKLLLGLAIIAGGIWLIIIFLPEFLIWLKGIVGVAVILLGLAVAFISYLDLRN